MIIGIDVDGTLAKAAPFVAPDNIGEPDPRMVEVVKTLHQKGHVLCIWSCRADFVVERWLQHHSLRKYFDYINCSPATTDSIKPSFDLIVDDKSLCWPGNAQDILDRAASGVSDPVTSDRDELFSSAAPVPYLAGTGTMYLDMFEKDWRRAWQEHDTCGKKIAFLTICSHAKPYSKSHIHSTIRAKLYVAGLLDHLDYVHLSNAGVIPSSAEMTYPFNAYDHNGADMSEELCVYFEELMEQRISDWYANWGHRYEGIVVYLRYGKTFRAAKRALGKNALMLDTFSAFDELGKPMPYVRLPDPDDWLITESNLDHMCRNVNTIVKRIHG